MRCAVLDDYQGVALSFADWGPLAGRVEPVIFREPFADEDEAAKALAGFEIILAMRERTPFPESLLARLPDLRLLVTTGMRNAAIDVPAARARGVTVCGTRGDKNSTVEIAWGLILNLMRKVSAESQRFRQGLWQGSVGTRLAGRRLGLLGLGELGGRVARVGQAFEMEVEAWSPNLTPERCAELGVTLAESKQALFRRADVISIHLVLSERSRGIVGEAELRAMQPSAYVVNTSRGPLIQRAALARALQEGWIAGAGLDVYDAEPPECDDLFRRLPNVIGTPHIGYVSDAVYRLFYGDAVEDIAAWLDGAPVREIA